MCASGGVAVGTSVNMVIEPFGALLIGAISGIISVVGYKYWTVGPYHPYIRSLISLTLNVNISAIRRVCSKRVPSLERCGLYLSIGGIHFCKYLLGDIHV